MSQVTIVERPPTLNEFKMLRQSVGWHNVDDKYITQALELGLYAVCIEIDGQCVGFGRVVGDGGLYFYIQDVIVLPEYQGNGYGGSIMQHIFKFLELNAPVGSHVALFAAKGVEPMYQKYGFVERPSEDLGAGMFQVWKLPNVEAV